MTENTHPRDLDVDAYLVGYWNDGNAEIDIARDGETRDGLPDPEWLVLASFIDAIAKGYDAHPTDVARHAGDIAARLDANGLSAATIQGDWGDSE